MSNSVIKHKLRTCIKQASVKEFTALHSRNTVISFQKIFGLYGLKHHIVEISGDVTDAGRDERQAKRRATQLLTCEPLRFAMMYHMQKEIELLETIS